MRSSDANPYNRQTVDISNEFEAAAIIGQSFEHDMQPYGRRRFIVEAVYRTTYDDRKNGRSGCYELSGRVYWGHETSRLFQHSSTRDIAGKTEHVYGIHLRHLATMEKISVAM